MGIDDLHELESDDWLGPSRRYPAGNRQPPPLKPPPLVLSTGTLRYLGNHSLHFNLIAFGFRILAKA
jgi:hypothetical protein